MEESDKQTIVIKLGGSLLDTLPDTFYQECVSLQQAGARVVIVHGGGPRINEFTKQLSLKPQFVNGLRVTDADVLELVEMVLGGSVNKKIVTRLEKAGSAAIGISGVDRGLLRVKQQDPQLGFVGVIEQVKTDVLAGLLALGWIPVIASLGVDTDGHHYNINADTAAGAIAEALEADSLVMVTDVPGIFAGEDSEQINRITPKGIDRLIAKGIIRAGMIPKVKAAAASVENGVKTVSIVDGHAKGILSGLLEQYSETFPGTKIVAEGSETGGINRDVYALADRTS